MFALEIQFSGLFCLSICTRDFIFLHKTLLCGSMAYFL